MKIEKKQQIRGPSENPGRTKSKWYRKKWLRVTAVCLVTVLVVSEFVIHYTAQQEIQTDFGPETLLDAQIQEVLKDPMKVLEAFKDAKRQLQDKQQKLLDACNKAEKLIKEEKYEEAKKLLRNNRTKLDKIAKFLYEKETITGKEFMDIFEQCEREEAEKAEASKTQNTENNANAENLDTQNTEA